MKEIHDDRFKFMPQVCSGALRQTLLAPVPPHLAAQAEADDTDTVVRGASTDFTAPGQGADLTRLPPPVSHLVDGGRPTGETRLSDRGKRILRSIQGRTTTPGARSLSSRERILRALTNDAYA